jgi:hypothetical protein
VPIEIVTADIEIPLPDMHFLCRGRCEERRGH